MQRKVKTCKKMNKLKNHSQEIFRGCFFCSSKGTDVIRITRTCKHPRNPAGDIVSNIGEKGS